MIDVRIVPLVELVSMKPTHSHVMLGLYRYADKHGVCFPGLRILAKAVSLAVRSLRRALEEMVELGYLIITKVKRGSVNRYQIAPRFLPTVRRDNEPAVEPAAAPEASPAVSRSRTGVSPSRTEGEAKERENEDLKKEEGLSSGRCAPLAATTATDQVAHSEPTNSRNAVRAAAAPAVNLPNAYEVAIKLRKKKAWVEKLNGFVMRHFGSDCERMMAFLEVVTRANDAVHDWASLSKDDRKTLDWLDERMRNWGLAA